MEIKNNNDLRSAVAYLTGLLNKICNSNSEEEIREDFSEFRKIATDLANFKIKSLNEGK